MVTLGAGVFSAPLKAQEPLRIIIDQGHLDPLPIALPPFIEEVDGRGQVGANLAQVITNNLQRSGLFRPLDPRSFLEPITDFNALPRFRDWRTINADALVTGEIVTDDGGRLAVQFRLYDALTERELVGKKYRTNPENWRRVAHLISDAIYERLTGEKGYFDTRIVFVAESGPRQRRTTRLGIMDQDGANPEFLTSGADLVLSPRFSPTSQEITYMSFKNNRPRVYLLNVETGQSEVVGDFPGMTFAPRFSPDGSRVAMTLEERGNSDIYLYDLARRTKARLTNHPSIDTSPTFAPDGNRLAFNSDRGGSRQLYVMDRNGGNVQRISFGDGKYSTPVWSPRGDLIAFTKLSK
ncbi:MAG: Tol-Pal system beta propeller repeat protein TolB, partial [Pseudomonadota bacterium]